MKKELKDLLKIQKDISEAQDRTNDLLARYLPMISSNTNIKGVAWQITKDGLDLENDGKSYREIKKIMNK